MVHKGKLTCEDKVALDVQAKLKLSTRLNSEFLLVEDTDQVCTQYRLLVQG